ncbi:MAG TPA: hypothetical protein VKG26_15810 [Bacteroidia bacterium]|nr:hypothetical protein [Bacteroidia bacterium]
MIYFLNTNYKTREITSSVFGTVLISTQSLNNNLLNSDGSYISDEALNLDEKIFYFVEDDEIELSEDKLNEIINNQVK